jgi:hypothetical protein
MFIYVLIDSIRNILYNYPHCICLTVLLGGFITAAKGDAWRPVLPTAKQEN